MHEEFGLGTDACMAAGLPQCPTKRVRGDLDLVVLGAVVVYGETIGLKRARRMLLAFLFL